MVAERSGVPGLGLVNTRQVAPVEWVDMTIRRFLLLSAILPLLLCVAWSALKGTRPRSEFAGPAAGTPPAAGGSAGPSAEPEIVGSERFREQVERAIRLLSSRDPDAYALVASYVGRIQEGERSGMWAYRTPPTYEMNGATAFASLTWCAATIAHDSFHSKLYHEYRETHAGVVPDSIWTGQEAERRCMTHQLLVMERIGASREELDHAKKHAAGQYVKDGETWEDYRKRNW